MAQDGLEWFSVRPIPIPSCEVLDMILFFKTPGIVPRAYSTQTHRMMQLQTDEGDFIKKVRRRVSHAGFGRFATSEARQITSQSFININRAVDLIKDEYADEKRRTGEHTYIHPMRVFMRGNIETDHIGLDNHETYHTTLLTRLLHDAQEDLQKRNFAIKLNGRTQFCIPELWINKTMQSFSISFDGQKKQYEFVLEKKQYELFRMQLDALTIPKEVDTLPDSYEKTQKQIEHLLQKTQEIYQEFGPFAAYETLRIKIDDRIDNVSTYFALGNTHDATKLKAKLIETILSFGTVEELAKKYFDLFREQGRQHLSYPDVDSAQSIVTFCYYLLRGGNYDDIFFHGITAARWERIQSLAGQMCYKSSRGIYDHFAKQFLIPSLHPGKYTRILT